MKTSTKWFVGGGVLVVIGMLLSWNHIFPAQPVILITNPNNLPGIATTTAPWAPEIAHLRERLHDIGLSALTQEGSAMHIHAHLDLFVNGARIIVPAGIGIDSVARFISPIHTHNASGIIHIESNVVRNFTLGQFFDVWGVRFTKDCIGGYCNIATSTLAVYANGIRVLSNSRALVLKEHEEIAVVFGTASSTQKISSTYAFPSGE